MNEVVSYELAVEQLRVLLQEKSVLGNGAASLMAV